MLLWDGYLQARALKWGSREPTEGEEDKQPARVPAQPPCSAGSGSCCCALCRCCGSRAATARCGWTGAPTTRAPLPSCRWCVASCPQPGTAQQHSTALAACLGAWHEGARQPALPVPVSRAARPFTLTPSSWPGSHCSHCSAYNDCCCSLPSPPLPPQAGYILGLGDRHPSNLMLDRYSGKLLHIDFGDCFEASMHREKFPERVRGPDDEIPCAA
jgi:hypothetical protein